MIGTSCQLYKKCSVCGKVKRRRGFVSKTGKMRRTYCRECRPYREKIKLLYPEWFVQEEKEICLDSSKLSGSKGFIYYRGKKRRWTGKISLSKAIRLVEEGAARVAGPTTIVCLFDRKSFREHIKNRDNRECQYCGNPGDTIDHIVAKSKGGLKTPANCVCACWRCNHLKDNLDVEDFIIQAQKRGIEVTYPRRKNYEGTGRGIRRNMAHV